MFCTKCGRESKEGTKFCTYCGAPLQAPVHKTVGAPSPAQAGTAKKAEKEKKVKSSQPVNPPATKKSNKGKVAIAIVAGVAILAVGFLAVGGILCNSREKEIADAIADYNIADYIQQKDEMVSDYEGYNFFDIMHKMTAIQDLTNVQGEAKKANDDLEEQRKSYEQMEEEKDNYDLADSYGEYTDSLDKWKEALDNKEYQNAVDASSDAEKKLNQLKEDNKTYVKNKLEQYTSVTWSGNDEKTYNDDVDEVNKLLNDEKYSDIKPVFEKMDELVTAQKNDEQSQESDDWIEDSLGEGPEDVVGQYITAFVDAMTEMDFSYISDYLKPGSKMYKDQKKYVQRGISESLDSYDIESVDYKDRKHCSVTTYESINVKKTDKPSKLVTQRCKYSVVLTDGEWKITDMKIL